MLIVALVMAAIGLTALVTAIVSGNEVIAWFCIAASLLGVVVLIVDAVGERRRDDEAVGEPAVAAASDTDGDEGATADEVPDAATADGAATVDGTAAGDAGAAAGDDDHGAADAPVDESPGTHTDGTHTDGTHTDGTLDVESAPGDTPPRQPTAP